MSYRVPVITRWASCHEQPITNILDGPLGPRHSSSRKQHQHKIHKIHKQHTPSRKRNRKQSCTTMWQDDFMNMSMEELDALSSSDDDDDDDSSNSSDDEDAGGKATATTTSARGHRKTKLADFAGFEDGCTDVDTDPLAKQMQAVLALRLSLRMDQDTEFMQEQEKKRLEREKMAKMTPVERLRYEEEKAGNLLSNVKQKFDLETIRKRRQEQEVLATKKEQAPPSSPECETTASESGSLSSDEAEMVSDEEEQQVVKKRSSRGEDKKKKHDKHKRKDSKHKKSDNKKKDSKHRKRKEELGDKKKLHCSHQPRRLEVI